MTLAEAAATRAARLPDCGEPPRSRGRLHSMTHLETQPTTLLGLLDGIPEGKTALVAPEQNIRLTYGDLRRQVESLAESLAGWGIERGDRVGMALPNGLPSIVAFLAASIAGTAAPLNPGYKEDEFRFYLEDTNARVLLLR